MYIINLLQWRIQDFPEEGAPIPEGGETQPIIWPIFPKNCMKIKKSQARGRAHVPRVPRALLYWP